MLKSLDRTRQFDQHRPDYPIGRRTSYEPPSTTSITQLARCHPESNEETKSQPTVQSGRSGVTARCREGQGWS